MIAGGGPFGPGVEGSIPMGTGTGRASRPVHGGTRAGGGRISNDFDAAIRVRQLDGSWAEGRALLDWLESGRTAAISHWFGRPDLFADTPRCEVTVLDGPEEALVHGR